MTRKKLQLRDLKVQSFVTTQSHGIRGGICSDECNLDSGCPDCIEGGSGEIGDPVGTGNTCNQSYPCVSLQGYNCPSNAGQWLC